MSNYGLMTKIWGPPGWLFLHSVTMGYPNIIDNNNPKHLIKKENMKLFFTSLGHTLPCELCCKSYLDFIQELPITEEVLSSRLNLAKWFYDIHNKVNEKLDVDQSEIPTFETFYNRYEMYRAKCGKKKKELGCTKSGDNIKKQSIIQIVDDDGNDYKICQDTADINDRTILESFYNNDDSSQLHLITSKTKDILKQQAIFCIQEGIGDIQKAKCIIDTI